MNAIYLLLLAAAAQTASAFTGSLNALLISTALKSPSNLGIHQPRTLRSVQVLESMLPGGMCNLLIPVGVGGCVDVMEP